MKRIFTGTMLLLSIATMVQAEGKMDYSTSGSNSVSGGFDTQEKLDKRKSHSDSKSKSKTLSVSDDEQLQTNLKKMMDAQKRRELNLDKPAQAVFMNHLIKLERDSSLIENSPHKLLVKAIQARPLTRPILPAHVGLSVSLAGNGGYDGIRGKYLSSSTSANATIEEVDADSVKIRQYIQTLAIYGGIVGQAYENLNANIDKIDVMFKTTGKKGRLTKGVRDIKIQEVASMGAEDFSHLARASLLQVFVDGITETTIKDTVNQLLASANEDCFLKASADNSGIACGEILLQLTNPSDFEVSGVPWFGKSFAGYQGSYKVSASWSYSKTLDEQESVSSSNKIARDWQIREEDAENKGKGVEAIMALKNGVELASKSSNSTSPTWKGGGK